MAEKDPCRWLVIETKVHFHCRHPLLWHLDVAEEDSTWGNSEAFCHGCPCHEPQPDMETDLNVCPNCGGPADNGFDRCVPPNPYWCTKCSEPKPAPNGSIRPESDETAPVRVHDKP